MIVLKIGAGERTKSDESEDRKNDPRKEEKRAHALIKPIGCLIGSDVWKGPLAFAIGKYQKPKSNQIEEAPCGCHIFGSVKDALTHQGEDERDDGMPGEGMSLNVGILRQAQDIGLKV